MPVVGVARFIPMKLEPQCASLQREMLDSGKYPASSNQQGFLAAGLMAHVIVAKFVDHLPLYRQEQIFGRRGLTITRSTVAQWGGQAGVHLQPLVDPLR